MDDPEQALQNVLSVIKCLYSEEQSIRDQATREIERWQKTPGFCSLLHVCQFDASYPQGLLYAVYPSNDIHSIKITLAMYKSTVVRYWYTYDGYTLSEGEKDEMRVKLIKMMMELDTPYVSLWAP
jgi:hypothetical protein